MAFNTGFLQGINGQPADLEALLTGNNVLPGNYRVDVHVNGTLLGRRDLQFQANPRNGLVEACLSAEMLTEFGVDVAALEAQRPGGESALSEGCYDLPAMVEQAEVQFHSGAQRLDISVPQALMQRGARGYVDESLWDRGVSAAYINYQLNSRRSSVGSGYQNSHFLGLQNGINLGDWRLRNESNLASSSGQPTRFTSNRTFLQREVRRLKSQLSMGELFTSGNLFDSVRFRGVQLTSDEGMLADSERGYAPVIRGVAETSATVEVRQNDYLLYSAPVPPGPFVLTDIYPNGSNGDLDITLIEADGRRRVFRQGFSSLPLMVRKGRLQFSVAAGRFHSNDERQDSPQFASGVVAYGLTDETTGVAGMQVAQDFRAANLGLGRNTPIGAVSVDVTHSTSKTPEATHRGQSIRLLYAKRLDATYTDFTLAAYRYSTEGYRTFNDHVNEAGVQPLSPFVRARTRTDLSVNQNLGRHGQYGSLYVTAAEQRYWNTAGYSQSLSAGYSNSWRQVGYSLDLSRTRNLGEGRASDDSQVSLSVSIPLGSLGRASQLSMRSTRDDKGDYNHQAGLTGVLSDNVSAYSLQTGQGRAGGTSSSASLSTQTSAARLDVGYSQGRDYRSGSLALAGSVVAHGGGINLGQPLGGDAFALIEVPDMPGVGVNNQASVRTGRNGFAVVPFMQPYRMNWIGLDAAELGADIELLESSQSLVPTRGAIVKAVFKAKSGRRVRFILSQSDGSPLPFGARIFDAEDRLLAISDPSSQALALVDEDAGTLTIKWMDQQCAAPYALPPRAPELNYDKAPLVCR